MTSLQQPIASGQASAAQIEAHRAAGELKPTQPNDMRSAAMDRVGELSISMHCAEPRFQHTYCSQCGIDCGPGDEGKSRCADHTQAVRDVVGYKAITAYGESAYFGLQSSARIWAGHRGSVREIIRPIAPALEIVKADGPDVEPKTLREIIDGATGEDVHVWFKVSDVRAALDDAERLRKALKGLVCQANNIEVLGEWSATDTNIMSGKKLRLQVDACITEAIAAIKAKS